MKDILSKKNPDTEKLNEYGLTEHDLLKNGDVRYYEFKNMDDGTSVVEELEFGQYPYEGVSFPLFSESANDLYAVSLFLVLNKLLKGS